MAPSRNALPDVLAGAIADGAAIDWHAADAAGEDAHAPLLRQLRVIAALRARSSASTAENRHVMWQVVTATYLFGVGAAGVKVLAFLGVAAAVLPQMGPRPLLFAAIVAAFGGGGVLMLAGGARDRRLALLGGLYVTIASAFAGPFPVNPPGTLGAVVDLLTWSKPEAFGALAVWAFAWTFPVEPRGRQTRRIAAVAIVLAAVAGLLLYASNLVLTQTAWPIEHPTGLAVLGVLNRKSVTSFFWPVIAVLAAPALPFLAYRAMHETTARRRQVRRFLGALAVGLLPILAVSVAAPFAPVLQESSVRRALGVGLYGALFAIVPMTAYAVTVNRIMDLQFVIRATLQYALARYAIWAAILAPLTYLALDVFVNRGLTFLQYLDARRPSGLLLLSGVGFVALTFRAQLVGAVDRWFQREPLDSSQALSRLEHRFRGSEHLREISVALADELTHALHAERVIVMLLAEDGASLVALDSAAPAIPTDSVLCELLQSTRSEIQLERDASLTRLLPDADQDWLRDTGARLLSPLVGSSGSLLGLVALANGTNDLPYTERHVSLVTTMCGHAAMQLENRWLRQAGGGPPSAPSPRTGVAWQDEPATWCPNCTEVRSAETRRCRCGTATSPAVLPVFVNAKFRLQRFLGAGGTGVVYLATDLALDRKVAIKTLPPMRREYAERLRREARAMASVLHPNLATIYGVEEWHDTPLLVVEYLEGGTLLDVLQRGPASVEDTLDLGIMLADVLDRVHGSGVLHRDIKPSNIGYTGEGVPKLLDFGLAAMLDRSKGLDQAAVVLPADPAELAARFRDIKASSTLTITHQVVGTPLYLSPEALAGQSPHESFDLWSLSMVLYEALTGRHPFGGRSVPDVVQAVQHVTVPDARDLRPDCPAPVAAFLNDTLSRVPARRPMSAAALRTQLRGLRAGLDQAI